MTRKFGYFTFLIITTSMACTVMTVQTTNKGSGKIVEVEKQRGVSWVAGNVITQEHLKPLIDHHVNWIVQTPFGWQKTVDSPEVALNQSSGFWGETDEGLRITTELARKQGIKTMLKPHIWLTSAGGKWRSDIAMNSDEDWKKWFASYHRFILHYAKFAEQNKIEALCIGTELRQTVVQRPDDWRSIIAEVRKVYHGQLTYAANWYKEFEEVPFWNELDYIGIQAYFPIATNKKPDVETLKRGWKPHLEAIQRVQRSTNKPVLFTELGYRSMNDAAIEPWKWPGKIEPEQIDFQTQANGYQAFYETFWNQPWFAGVYWWKWYPVTKSKFVASQNPDFSPQGKPAAKIMSQWYGRDVSSKKETTDTHE